MYFCVVYMAVDLYNYNTVVYYMISITSYWQTAMKEAIHFVCRSTDFGTVETLHLQIQCIKVISLTK